MGGLEGTWFDRSLFFRSDGLDELGHVGVMCAPKAAYSSRAGVQAAMPYETDLPNRAKDESGQVLIDQIDQDVLYRSLC